MANILHMTAVMAIVFGVYGGGHILLYFRLKQALDIKRKWQRRMLAWTILLLAAAYPLSRAISKSNWQQVTDVLVIVGGLWMGIAFYTMGFLLLTELLRLLKLRLRGKVVVVIGAAIVIGINVYGYYRATHPVVKELYIASSKVAYPVEVVFISDLHLGTIMNQSRLTTYVEKINQLRPDMMLIGGDITEDNGQKIGHMAQILAGLRAPLGVYGVLGNHEYYSGIEQAIDFIKSANIRLLRGQSVSLAGLNVTGIDDITGYQRYGEPKSDSKALLAGVDKTKFTILMHHRPTEVESAVQGGADLMLSGHTHNGQLYPLSHITAWVYPEVSYGYRKIGNMHAYVSAGLGSWGTLIRVGADPDIVHITIAPE